MPLSARELEAVSLALEGKGVRVGRLLGAGTHAATYSLKGSDEAVVKVLRDGADAEWPELADLTPRVQWRGQAGLLNVRLVERVDPGDSASRGLRLRSGAESVDCMHKLSAFDAQAVHALFRRAVAAGCVHLDPHLGNLGWTPAQRPVFMDTGAFVSRVMSAQDREWATALQLGLFLERTPPRWLEQHALFREFCGTVFGNDRMTLAEVQRRSGDEDWALSKAVSVAGADNPNLDLYVACLLLASYLPRSGLERSQLAAPQMVADIQRQKAVWLPARVAAHR
jgi:hypothetical protein